MIIYVDFENVLSPGIAGLSQLGENDQINIVYSNVCNRIDIDVVQEIQNSETAIDYIKSELTKPDAADFVLITHLFAQIRKDSVYYIVSKDKGFDSAIREGIKLGYTNVKRVESIAEIVSGSAENVINERPPIYDDIGDIVDFEYFEFASPIKEKQEKKIKITFENSLVEGVRKLNLSKARGKKLRQLIRKVFPAKKEEYKKKLLETFKDEGNSLYKKTEKLYVSLLENYKK